MGQVLPFHNEGCKKDEGEMIFTEVKGRSENYRCCFYRFLNANF